MTDAEEHFVTMTLLCFLHTPITTTITIATTITITTVSYAALSTRLQASL